MSEKIKYCLKWVNGENRTAIGALYPYSAYWDKRLLCNIKNKRIVSLSRYEVAFENGDVVWISNKWYAYGQPVKEKTLEALEVFEEHRYVMPSIRTAEKLEERIQNLRLELCNKS